jgi:hypothetical protein
MGDLLVAINYMVIAGMLTGNRWPRPFSRDFGWRLAFCPWLLAAGTGWGLNFFIEANFREPSDSDLQ